MKAATIRNRAVQLPIVISIHAAREGGDKHVKPQPKQPGISIHAAREGGDYTTHITKFYAVTFQSAPPVKAATRALRGCVCGAGISIHAAREGGDRRGGQPLRAVQISIHAAREGGDPVRQVLAHKKDISIHAAREGGDAI